VHVLVFINYWIEKCTVKHWKMSYVQFMVRKSSMLSTACADCFRVCLNKNTGNRILCTFCEMPVASCIAQIFPNWINFKLCTSNPFVLLLLLKHGFQNTNIWTARVIGSFVLKQQALSATVPTEWLSKRCPMKFDLLLPVLKSLNCFLYIS